MQTTSQGRRHDARRLGMFRTECEETRSGPGANVSCVLTMGACGSWEDKICKTEPAALYDVMVHTSSVYLELVLLDTEYYSVQSTSINRGPTSGPDYVRHTHTQNLTRYDALPRTLYVLPFPS
jgi:hypothetical protein